MKKKINKKRKKKSGTRLYLVMSSREANLNKASLLITHLAQVTPATDHVGFTLALACLGVTDLRYGSIDVALACYRQIR